MVSKSFIVYSSFSESEKQDFNAFISFYAPTRSDLLIKLTDAYKLIPPNSISLPKNELIKKLFKKGSETKLRLLQSDLQKVMERFIIWRSLNQDSAPSRKILLDYYKSVGLKHVLEKTIKQYKKATIKSQVFDLNHSEEQLLLAEEAYEFAIQARKEAKYETENLGLKLDYFYILKKLKLSCLVRSQENVYNLTFEQGLKDEVIAYIEENKLMQDALIGSYYYCYKMLAENKVGTNFDSFFFSLEENQQRFSVEENTQLYSLAINYCIRSLNQGNKEIGRKGLDLYTSSLDNGILLQNGKISKFTFRNIVTMAIRLEEFQMAANFIEKYQLLLDKKDKKDMVHFTTALVQFSKQEYENASDELLQVHFKELLFNLAAKVLQLKIFYEQGEIMVLQSHLDALQIFLKRHQSLGYHKQNYQNIIALTRKLINAKSNEKLHKLKQLVVSEGALTEKKWFIEKIAKKRKHLR